MARVRISTRAMISMREGNTCHEPSCHDHHSARLLKENQGPPIWSVRMVSAGGPANNPAAPTFSAVLSYRRGGNWKNRTQPGLGEPEAAKTPFGWADYFESYCQ